MFYYFSRFLVRLNLSIYLRKICRIRFDTLPEKTPLLLASNHPDSFFDGIVLGAIFKQQSHALTRGDVFAKPAAAFWLRQVNLIPVFRATEGRQNVRKHDETTKESYNALKKGHVVIIFSEGICKNEWKLRPLGKGTARMAYQIWYGEGALQNMQVVPTGLTYEHFHGPGKRVMVRFGDGIRQQDIKTSPEEYERWLREFNEILERRMQNEILTLPEELTKEEKTAKMNAFFGDCTIPPKGNGLQQALGSFGRAIHQPLYSFLTKKINRLTARSVFYDSVLFGVLVYLYPIIVTLLSVTVGALAGWPAGIFLFFALPLLAWMGGRFR